MCLHIYIYLCSYHIYTHVFACIHTCTHTYIHQYIYIHIYIYICICIYTHIHRHSYMYRYKSRKLAPWSLRELLFTNSFLGEIGPPRPFCLKNQGLLGPQGAPLPPPALLLDISDAGRFDKGGGGGGPSPPPQGPPPLLKALCEVSSCHCCCCVPCSMLGNFYCGFSIKNTLQSIIAISISIRLQGWRTTFACFS